MGKNRGIIKKLMVILGSVFLISAGITYFAIKRGDENYIKQNAVDKRTAINKNRRNCKKRGGNIFRKGIYIKTK